MPACLPEQLPRRTVGFSPSRISRRAVSPSYGAWTWFWSTELVSPARRRISWTRRTCRSSPEWLAAMIASASEPRPNSSKRPEATNGASWNGLALERRKMNWSGSPAAAIRLPSGRARTTDPRWTDSTRSPRVTSTSTGGASGPRRPERAPRRVEVAIQAGTERPCAPLLPAAALAGGLALARLGRGLLCLAIALAEDASARAPGSGGTTRSAPAGGPSLGRLVAGTGRRRRRARTGLAGHRDATFPVGTFLDDQHLRFDVALDAAGGADLEASTAVDVALVVAVDDHVVRLDRAANARLRADDQGALALDLALRLPLDSQVAVTDVLPVETGVGVDDRLVAAIAGAGE